MNRYTETAYFMQKDSRKFGTLYYLLYVCRHEEAGGDRVRGGNGGIKNL